MGNITTDLRKESTSKYILSDKNLFQLESELLNFANIPREEIIIKNIKVGDWLNPKTKTLEDIYTRSFICGHTTKSLNKETKPILVFVHGFAASCCLFYKIYGMLSKYFCLIMIDIIGMGGSSRPDNFSRKNGPQESIDYFINYFEKWRIAMNNLTNFYLAGHSFGGYLVGNYALKYHKHIRKLILLSPVGIRVPAKQIDGYQEFVLKAKQVKAQGGAAPPLYYHAVMKILWR